MFLNLSALFTSCRMATLSHTVHIALFGMLLLTLGCGSLRTAVVPRDQLSNFPIRSESVQVETAGPFVEHIELRQATLQFPMLSGVVTAFDAPWRIRMLQQPLRLNTRGGMGVEVLSDRSPIAPLGDAAPQTGARVLVYSRGPFPSRIELSSATLVNHQLTGIVRGIEAVASNEIIGRQVTLDVSTLKNVVVYRMDKRLKRAGWALIGTGGILALLCGPFAIPSGTSIPYVGGLVAQIQIGFAIGAGIGGALAAGGIVALIKAKWTHQSSDPN
jgi:hypothetical protein